jgi:predicted SAM-dependent methyltransferase
MEQKLVKLNLGAGVGAKAGWVNVDKYIDPVDLKAKAEAKDPSLGNGFWEEGAEYIQADIEEMPFSDNYADIVEMHEVLEHVGFRHVLPILKEVYRVMKPGAKAYIDVPSFNGLALDWIQMALEEHEIDTFDIQKYAEVMETIYGTQVHEGEFHRCAFTIPFLNFCVLTAGFTKGDFEIHYKGTKMPQIGELSAAKGVLRHDIIIANLIK